MNGVIVTPLRRAMDAKCATVGSARTDPCLTSRKPSRRKSDLNAALAAAKQAGFAVARVQVSDGMSSRPFSERMKGTVEVIEKIGAGEGNRTLVFSLEGCCSTIELHPRAGIT